LADDPDVILTNEVAIGADPVGFRELRSRFPRAVIVALVAPFGQRTGAIDGVQCTVEKPVRSAST
jgi:hypothetical protein